MSEKINHMATVVVLRHSQYVDKGKITMIKGANLARDCPAVVVRR